MILKDLYEMPGWCQKRVCC